MQHRTQILALNARKKNLWLQPSQLQHHAEVGEGRDGSARPVSAAKVLAAAVVPVLRSAADAQPT